jgi:pyruvate dehydrogenase E1 component beta subunit
VTLKTVRQAAVEAVAEEMRRDPRVWALGEDLGRGGLFQQYRGLTDEFGPSRVVDTPICEATIMGAAVGAAMVGTRPIVDLRSCDFALSAVDEIVNQAAKARYMFGGQTRVPVVIRQPFGIWRSQAAQHTQSLESWWIHVPGLVVVAPSMPADSKGLLKSAIRCDDPVVIMEHKTLWESEGEVPDDEYVIPIGSARVVMSGGDVTVVSWSAACLVAEEAARIAGDKGVSVELIDLRSLWPWDKERVFESVAKTRRFLVVHEAVEVCGFGAEIAATVGEEFGEQLMSRVRRLGAPRIPVPFAPELEASCRIQAPAVASMLEAMCQERIRSL